jgi:hypothetical protein
MNERERPPEGGDEREELEERIHLLSTLTVEPELGFMSRLRGRIQRRTLVSDMATLSWSATAHVFFEYLIALFGLFGGGHDRRKS